MVPYSIYIHIPFCSHRCAYCDFNTYAGMEKKIPAYVAAVCREIAAVAQAAPERLPVHSIFLGGGTPSIVPPEEHAHLIDAIRSNYTVLADCEVTLEANPGSVSDEGLRRLRQIGYNRISFGMQSADDRELRWLTRQHRAADVDRAVTWARQAGFENLSLDLIFGLPNQTLETWKASLEKAFSHSPDHLSLYSLIVEPETPLYRWVERGLVEDPDDDHAAEMYDWSMGFLEERGFVQYEISNWAKQSADQSYPASVHNLQYWLDQPYLGFGAGAHGYAAGTRTVNVLAIDAYIAQMSGAEAAAFPCSMANSTRTTVPRSDEISELMMVGLRLTEEGVTNTRFFERFGVHLDDVFPVQIEKLVNQGLLEWVGEPSQRLRLTRRGRLLGNRVFREFI